MPHIMTPEGWKPLLPMAAPVGEVEAWRNPFRSWESVGAKSYVDWISR
jgi:hypothetical protein